MVGGGGSPFLGSGWLRPRPPPPAAGPGATHGVAGTSLLDAFGLGSVGSSPAWADLASPAAGLEPGWCGGALGSASLVASAGTGGGGASAATMFGSASSTQKVFEALPHNAGIANHCPDSSCPNSCCNSGQGDSSFAGPHLGEGKGGYLAVHVGGNVVHEVNDNIVLQSVTLPLLPLAVVLLYMREGLFTVRHLVEF